MVDHDTEARADSLKRALLAIRELNARLAALENAQKEPIAIVGVGCRLPGAIDSPDDFWEALAGARDLVTPIPGPRRNLLAEHAGDAAPFPPFGGFLRNLDEFDYRFFGISPAEAREMDPQQRLLLETSWNAIVDAGYDKDRLYGSQTGVYVGVGSQDYLLRHLRDGSTRHLNAHTATGNAPSAGAGRLSYVYGLTGPSVTLDTACSTSLVALHEACKALRVGEVSLALVGAANLILAPHVSTMFSHSGMLAPDGRCKVFDHAANGYVRSEGCIVFVLKRLADARRDRDPIHALVRGSAVNQNGPSGGLTVPNGPSQEAVIRAALGNAGVAPATVSYVEAHGTGTSLGDPIEVRALANAYGAPDRETLRIGSVKSNLGHLEVTAGLAGLLKTVLMLRHRRFVPNLHFHAPNRKIDWTGIDVVRDASDWSGPHGTRLAGVSSFGFSGTNAHVIVGEAPEDAPRPSSGTFAAFDRKRCWWNDDDFQDDADAGAPALPAYVRQWERLDPTPSAVPGAAAILLLDRASAFGDMLCAHWQRDGVNVRRMAAAGPDMRAAIADMSRGGSLDVMVLLDMQAWLPDSPEGWDRAACGAVLAVAQALIDVPADREVRLRFVTRRAQAVVAGDGVDGVGAAPVWGMQGVIASELPHVRVGGIDIEHADEETAGIVLAALARCADEPAIAIRGRSVFVSRLAAHDFAGPADMDAAPIRSDAAYVVSGAFGGIGRLVAERLVARGARYLMLIGRRHPSEADQAWLAALRKAAGRDGDNDGGAGIRVVVADVADEHALAAALAANADGLPRVAGIMHCAAHVSDALIKDQQAAALDGVLGVKAQGAWNLFRAIGRDAPLDFFVLFSSAAAVVSSPGLVSYCAANGYLDAFAHYLRHRGIPATSIGWGQWDGVGLGARTNVVKRLDQNPVTRPIAPGAAAAFLDRLAGSAIAHCVVVPIDWTAYFAQHPDQVRNPFWRGMLPPAPSAGADLPAAPPAQEHIGPAVRAHVEQMLNPHGDLHIEPGRALSDYGLDSLVAMELRNRFVRQFGLALPVNYLYDVTTVDDIAADLGRRMHPASVPPQEHGADTAAPAARLTGLSIDQLTRHLDEKLKDLS